jgi:Trk-type K+ transport system membrane component
MTIFFRQLCSGLYPRLGVPFSFTGGLAWIHQEYRFSLFQMVSAYTNTGTSLVDQSMVPFQTAYPMVVFVMLMILAGNTAFVS